MQKISDWKICSLDSGNIGFWNGEVMYFTMGTSFSKIHNGNDYPKLNLPKEDYDNLLNKFIRNYITLHGQNN